MTKYKPVSIPSNAFTFCRISLALLVWVSYLFHSKGLLVVVFFLFLFSAILKIKKAPMIVIYANTIEKLFKSKAEVVNEPALYFAHLVGTSFSALSLVFLYLINEQAGWILVLIFALLKSISALGFCPAAKLYDCSNNDNCCAFAKKALKKNVR
ncbi:MAG: DUF4395 family protein [Candidatus Pacebacteria bacterium]|nr:DUF4395 family protein [Candidatus Paceibacterota bacterium]